MCFRVGVFLLFLCFIPWKNGYGEDSLTRLTLAMGRKFMSIKDITIDKSRVNRIVVMDDTNIRYIDVEGQVFLLRTNDIPVKASQLAAGVKGRVSVAFSLYNKIAPGKIIARGTIVNFDNSETASAISYGAELMRWCGMPLDVIATNYLVGQCDGVVMFAHREVTSREKHYLPADIDKWGIVIYHNLVLRLVVYDNETIRRNRRKVAFEILKMFCPNVDAGCSVAADIKNNVFAQRIPRNNVGIVNSF